MEQAQELVERAKQVLKDYEAKGQPLPRSPYADLLEKNSSDAKSQADLRLKQELERLKEEEKGE
ncbi:MAG: hypothetical protein NZ480_00530 [Bdellovibrionaceae bacterium]|nr:hypothetical protein [Pseudobdellovibrionaceae bacterium]